ncbi:hypothetical protein [Photobacterium indicum]|uniref:Uncharacterized protein n=1 Tax=Photobacterium indicum TaxID=81447 RepID=A0A2T3LF97_9GAMM|nr:hypothetical protein [Photobacterium indicum]PSV50018.1 hypothetical protein C9J47_05570 [Photobacterium indicum]
MVKKFLKYMLDPEKLTKKLEAKFSDKECDENPEMLIDDDGNMSLNFENEEVYKAFNSHLDAIEAQEEKARKKVNLSRAEVAA